MSYDITFKVKVDGVDQYVPIGDCDAPCTACKRKMNPSQYGYAFCSLCGAKMDGRIYNG